MNEYCQAFPYCTVFLTQMLESARKEDWMDWAKLADEKGVWYEGREGKDVAIFRVEKTVTANKRGRSFQFIVKAVERTMEPDDQLIGFTDGSIEGWWTSLNVSNEKVIALYENHATSDQFHFKRLEAVWGNRLRIICSW